MSFIQPPVGNLVRVVGRVNGNPSGTITGVMGRAGQRKGATKSPARRGGALYSGAIRSYAFSFRRIAPARPTSPVPSRVKDPGSGTVMLVSPLEIEVDPLKKPLPVLMVIWTVAPTTVLPSTQVPS